MLLTLDPEDPRPLYRQIAAAVRHAIADGDLLPGARLPAGRDLAEALGVNLATVQRAYRLLVDDGLIVSRVGRGTRVVDGADPGALALDHEIDRLIAQAARVGVTVDELADRIRHAADPPGS